MDQGPPPGVDPVTGRHARVRAAALLDWLVPGGSRPRVPSGRPDPLDWPGYGAARDEAVGASGSDESVQVVRGRLRGTDTPAVVVAWEFDFLGGSMGRIAGERIAAAYDHATADRLPLVLLTSTGGARMQEGMTSLVQLPATVAAAQDHRDAGLLQVAVLRDPTFGGVFASHANVADLLLAEPGARLGFAGPRVSEAMTGGPLPSMSHTAVGAAAAGLVDAVVPRGDLPSRLAALFGWAADAQRTGHDRPRWTGGDVRTGEGGPTVVDLALDGADPWAAVVASRAEDRARTPALLARSDVELVTELRGDRAGGVDRCVRVGPARWRGRPVVVIAMDPAGGSIGPAGYRTAWRGLDLAERTGVPVVTIIDTPGADASATAEAGGIAHHIAETTRRLLTLPVPVVSLVVGEGGSGGALALGCGDRLLMQEHATFSVIGAEGAAAILHRDPGRAPEVAALLDPTARRLAALGIADEVVAEPDGDPLGPAVAAVDRHLAALETVDGRALVTGRRARWRRPLA